MRRLLVALVVCLVPACSKPSSPAQGMPAQAPAVAVKAPEAKPKAPEYPYPECSAILAWLKDNLDDPKTMELVKWETRTESPKDAPRKSFYVRARVRHSNKAGALQIYTMLFTIQDGKVVQGFDED